MEKRWPTLVTEWARHCNVQKDEQYGGTFDGNSCRLLLQHCDALDAMITLESKRFVTVFKMLNNVVASCFGNDLHEDYHQAILNFKQAYLDLEMPVTPKIHAIFNHITEFCATVNVGLGRFSEQASESVHHSFNVEWLRHKVNDDNPEYPSRLLRAVTVYNCKHI